jgi:hypothetical protein
VPWRFSDDRASATVILTFPLMQYVPRNVDRSLSAALKGAQLLGEELVESRLLPLWPVTIFPGNPHSIMTSLV